MTTTMIDTLRTSDSRTYRALRRLVAAMLSIPAGIQAGFTTVRRAHEHQALLASLPRDVMSDTGLSPDDLVTVRDCRDALPFFMQIRPGAPH
jgi:hypothetical protein